MSVKVFILTTAQEARRVTDLLLSTWEPLARAGRPIAVEVRPGRAKRSTRQNAFYWSRLREIADQFQPEGKRFTEEALHEFFKREFIGVEDLPGGQQMSISSGSLDTAQFAEFVTQVEAYASREMGVRFLEL